ncbi:hypothetical protein M0804_000247 [Polistes exclamans]|nr:hypothetical protein M0804_000247 [Polistes exclamans]
MAAGEVIGWNGDAVPSSGTPSASIQSQLTVPSLESHQRRNTMYLLVTSEHPLQCCVPPRDTLYQLSEPVNRAAPKVPPTAKITVLELPVEKALAMLCQAQANPLPVFRYALMQIEPIGSSPPRLPPRSKFDGMMKIQGQAVTLLCEAQGSPLPLYSTRLPITRIQFKASRHPHSVVSLNRPTLLAEPTGNVSPRIAGERYEGGKLVDVPKMTTAALDCATQGFPVPVTRGYHQDSTAFLGQEIRGMGSGILFSGSERSIQSLASGISCTFDKVTEAIARLRKGCGPSSPLVTSVLIRVDRVGVTRSFGANNVALHLYTPPISPTISG